jgi:hypothetical protein
MYEGVKSASGEEKRPARGGSASPTFGGCNRLLVTA